MHSRILAPALTIVAGIGLALPGSPATAQQAHLPTHVNDCWSTDRVAPVVDSLSVSPGVVHTDTSAIVRFTVKAHDLGGPGPRTGVGRVEVSLQNKVGGGGVAATYLTRGSDGLWHGAATVPAGRKGTYDAEVRVWDRSGDGTITLQTGEGEQRFFGHVMEATGTTTPPPPPDTTPPSLTAFHVSAGEVDTRKKGQTLTLTATATDDVSGVASFRVDFQPNNGSGAHHTLLRRVGTSDDFQGEARFRTATGNHYEGLGVVVTDLAGNTAGYGRGGLRKLGVTPRIRVLSGPQDPRGPRVVRMLQAAPSVDVHPHGQWYPVRLLMTDPQGVTSVSAHLRGETPDVTLHRVSGTRSRGVWAGRLRVHRCSFGPVTVPLHVNATDGHRVTHGTAVRAVRILSPDRTPPRVARNVGRLADGVPLLRARPRHLDQDRSDLRHEPGPDLRHLEVPRGSRRSLTPSELPDRIGLARDLLPGRLRHSCSDSSTGSPGCTSTSWTPTATRSTSTRPSTRKRSTEMTMTAHRLHTARRVALTTAASLALAAGALSLPHATAATGATGATRATRATGAAAAMGAAASTTPPTHANRCWPRDNGAPVIDSFTVTPSVVDTTAGPVTVHLTVAAHDTGGPGPAVGVGSAQVDLSPESPTPASAGLYLDRPLTLGSDGLWHATARLPRGAVGTLDAVVSVADRVHSPILPTVGRFGYGAGFHGAGHRYTAVAQVSSSPSDTTAPTLTGLSLSSQHVNTQAKARLVTVTATAADVGTGVASVIVDILPAAHRAPSHHVVLDRVGSTDQYRGSTTFLRWLGNHQEGVNVAVTDRTGNATYLRPRQLAARGLPAQVTVVSGPRDTRGPRIELRKAARSIDVRKHGRWYVVRAHVTDPQGVSFVRINLKDLNLRPVHLHLHRVSGTVHHGIWAGRIRVPRCVPGPITSRLRVVAQDSHGVWGSAPARNVRIHSANLVSPTLSRADWRGSPQTFTFSEPVHGISADNVQVYDNDTSSGPHPLAGSWRCRNAKGHKVDCLTGSVAMASFTSSDPSRVAGVVVWEPEHHLAVLDAHGNPFTYPSVAPDVED